MIENLGERLKKQIQVHGEARSILLHGHSPHEWEVLRKEFPFRAACNQLIRMLSDEGGMGVLLSKVSGLGKKWLYDITKKDGVKGEPS